MMLAKYLKEAHQVKLCIRRHQAWIRKNPICASDPGNYAAQQARKEIGYCKARLRILRCGL